MGLICLLVVENWCCNGVLGCGSEGWVILLRLGVGVGRILYLRKERIFFVISLFYEFRFFFITRKYLNKCFFSCLILRFW